MKNIIRFAGLAIILFAVSAFAADQTKFSFDIVKPMTIAGTTLQPGTYNVVVDRDGSNAKVAVMSGKKVVVNTTATVKEDATVRNTAATLDASRNVKELSSQKLKGALVFAPAAGAPAANGGR